MAKKKEEAKPVEKPKVEEKVEEPIAASSPKPTEDQQAEIDKVFAAKEAEIKTAVAAILGGNGTELGTPSGDIEHRQEATQADHIPGTHKPDKTYVPEYVDDEDGSYRRVLIYSDYRYCMIPADDFLTYRMNGWKHCMYDGGSRSGLAGEGWQHTGDTVFTRDIRGYCQRGDCYLMYIPIRGWEEIRADDQAKADNSMKGPIGHFMNEGYGKGIRGFAEIEREDGSVERID